MRPPLRPTCLQQVSLLPRRRRLRAPPQRFVRCRIATTWSAHPAPLCLPRLIVSPGSVHHNSLPSFLEYANRTNLAPSKTYYVGTHYEYVVALSLLRLGFSLLRVGRKADAGIDLMGHWVLPPLREPLPVIAQCKARKISCNPQHIRELEGSFQGIPADWRNKHVLGLLVTTQNASKGVLEALGMSRWPLGFIKISRSGTVEQFLWNRAASEGGLEGVGVTVRHTPRALLYGGGDEGAEDEDWEPENRPKRGKRVAEKFRTAGTKRDIQLTWMGSPIFPDREGLDDETLRLMGIIAPEEEDAVEESMRKTPARTKRAVVTGATTKKATEVTKRTAVSNATGHAPKKRGRPPGSTRKGVLSVRRGTRLGSTKKKPVLPTAKVAPKKRGRPKGSKNKTKGNIAEG